MAVDRVETLSLVDGEDRLDRPSPRAHLFVCFDAARPLATGSRHALAGIDGVELGRGAETRVIRTDGTLTISLADRWMSTAHARLRKVEGEWRLEDGGSKNGTLLNGTRTQNATLRDGDFITLGQTFLLFRDQVPTSPRALLDLDGAPAMSTLSPELELVLDALAAVAPSKVPVLVRGETGTGKENIARTVHKLSRRAGPFVAVNSGSLPDALVTSELFGYKAGAFSGATEDRPGLVRSADGGTLFLDELGDLPEAAQTALLRVLQEGEVLPVGATRPVTVDVRVVAATHRDLEAMVTDGTFREDLMARLRGFTVRLPPLRERREDLGLMVSTLLRKHAPDHGDNTSFSLAAAQALVAHDWPQNVRELERRLATAAVLARGRMIEAEQLFEPTVAPPPADGERSAVIAALQATSGNIVQTAQRLSTHPRQIYRWIEKHGLSLDDYRKRR